MRRQKVKKKKKKKDKVIECIGSNIKVQKNRNIHFLNIDQVRVCSDRSILNLLTTPFLMKTSILAQLVKIIGNDAQSGKRDRVQLSIVVLGLSMYLCLIIVIVTRSVQVEVLLGMVG